MNSSLPKITIVTPSFNTGKFLEETILSVINQDYPQLEFFVVDGGSSDNSVEIIRKYDKYISFWVSDKDNGQSEAINKGFVRATGSIVTWLNSDDLLCKGALHKVASHFQDNEHVGVIHGKALLFGEGQKEVLRDAETDSLGCQYFAGMSFPQPSSFFRKDVLDQIGFLDSRMHYGMDYDFFLRAACITSFLRVEDTFSKYRLHIESKSKSAPQKFALEWKLVFSKFLRSIENSEEVIQRMKLLNCYVEGTDHYSISRKFEPEFLLATFSYFLYYQIIFLYESGDVKDVYDLTKYLRDFDPRFFEKFELKGNYLRAKYLHKGALYFEEVQGDMAFFSVVIPTFNRANLIVPTIQSVQAQSFTDYEIIVVDDGSTDETKDVVTDLKVLELRYVRTSNMERGHARNEGMRLAIGDFVVFLDSDDLFEKNHLQILFEEIKTNPACNFFASKYRFLTPTGSIKSSTMLNLQQGFYTYIDLLKGNFLACNFCMRRINSKIKWFEEGKEFSIMEDWMFLIENLRYDRLYLVNEFTVLLRDHQDRSMNSDNQKIINRKLLATQWIEEHVLLSPYELKLMQAYSFYFCAIHAYLDHKKAQAIRFIFSAIRLNGLNFSYLLLFSKVLIGKNLINILRNEA